MKPALDLTSTEALGHLREPLSAEENVQRKSFNHDPMRRFLPTPYTAILPVMGRAVRLETNSSAVRRYVTGLFSRYSNPGHGHPQFVWRIVVDSTSEFSQPWPRRSVFSGDGLRFAQFGQRNFLAVDIDAREAVAFVSQKVVADRAGFTSPFIDTLFYMTAGSLGLIPFSAACVASGTNGLLVLGSPNQGKTTACYLASQRGLSYHADQSVFLERPRGELRAWSDFVPIAFRPDAFQFLPELQSRARQYSYCDFKFYYVPKRSRDLRQPGFVIPNCCLVLERGSSSAPSLTLLRQTEFSRTISEHLAFRDDDRFEQKYPEVLARLANVPAYHLAYGTDPATAVPFFFELLAKHRTHHSAIRLGS